MRFSELTLFPGKFFEWGYYVCFSNLRGGNGDSAEGSLLNLVIFLPVMI